MRKLIEKTQDSLIVCDTQKCDFSIQFTDNLGKHIKAFINKPCPRCNENLLTMEDYLLHQKMIQIVNFINQWFSWITLFYSKKRLDKRSSVSIKVHDGIKISVVVQLY